MTAPDLTEARDLAAMWQARAEAAEREARTLSEECDGLMSSLETIAWDRDEAWAIIAGRSEAPTPEEIAALHAADGAWLVRFVGSEGPAAERLTDRYGATVIARDQRAGWYQRGVRWWPRNAEGRFVAWPVAP